jgi:hypothetical protein
MSIVLRDSGASKFVRYVSKKAKRDRWDVSGSFGVVLDDDKGKGEEVTLDESSDDKCLGGVTCWNCT